MKNLHEKAYQCQMRWILAEFCVNAWEFRDATEKGGGQNIKGWSDKTKNIKGGWTTKPWNTTTFCLSS